jgi:hypothetical protein
MTGMKSPLLFLALLPTLALSQPCMERYERDCLFATTFYEAHKQDFEQAAARTGLSAPLLFAIVAPELTQYSSLGNRVETYSLKVFYVQRGRSYADFSIGLFQMKPSFVECLEDSLLSRKHLHAAFENCLLPDPDSRTARAERVRRLGQLEWQLTYLALFCELVRERFPAQSSLPDDERLIFYSAAYNAGFHKSETAILQTAKQALFPHFSREKYRYSDVALCFYKTANP